VCFAGAGPGVVGRPSRSRASAIRYLAHAFSNRPTTSSDSSRNRRRASNIARTDTLGSASGAILPQRGHLDTGGLMARDVRICSSCACMWSRSSMMAAHDRSERQPLRRAAIISGNHVWLLSPLAMIRFPCSQLCLANTGDKLRASNMLNARQLHPLVSRRASNLHCRYPS
jgi:hypothetical protein